MENSTDFQKLRREVNEMSEQKQTYEEVAAERDAYKAENDALKQDRVNRQAKNSVFLNLFTPVGAL